MRRAAFLGQCASEEHVDGLDRCKVSTPLGEHRLRSYSGAVVGTAVTILARDSDMAQNPGGVVDWVQ